jgi:coenzyme PQQ precursor peptide PqqA
LTVSGRSSTLACRGQRFCANAHDAEKPALCVSDREKRMKLEWHKPTVTEQSAGMEVTSYSSAELGVG